MDWPYSKSPARCHCNTNNRVKFTGEPKKRKISKNMETDCGKGVDETGREQRTWPQIETDGESLSGPTP